MSNSVVFCTEKKSNKIPEWTFNPVKNQSQLIAFVQPSPQMVSQAWHRDKVHKCPRASWNFNIFKWIVNAFPLATGSVRKSFFPLEIVQHSFMFFFFWSWPLSKKNQSLWAKRLFIAKPSGLIWRLRKNKVNRCGLPFEISENLWKTSKELFLVPSLRAIAEVDAEKVSFPIKKESFVSSLVQKCKCLQTIVNVLDGFQKRNL